MGVYGAVLVALSLHADAGVRVPAYAVSGAPSGACVGTRVYVTNTSPGELWCCRGGVWGQCDPKCCAAPAATCPEGQVVRGGSDAGTLVCVPLPDPTCPEGQVARGWNPDAGTLVCVPQPAAICPEGTTVAGWDPGTGALTCVGIGYGSLREPPRAGHTLVIADTWRLWNTGECGPAHRMDCEGGEDPLKCYLQFKGQLTALFNLSGSLTGYFSIYAPTQLVNVSLFRNGGSVGVCSSSATFKPSEELTVFWQCTLELENDDVLKMEVKTNAENEQTFTLTHGELQADQMVPTVE